MILDKAARKKDANKLDQLQQKVDALRNQEEARKAAQPREDWVHPPWKDSMVTDDENARRWQQELQWRKEGFSHEDRIRKWKMQLGCKPLDV